MIIISACLCGCNCKYNGGNNKIEQCVKIFKTKRAMLICPEQLGGLTTPRLPSEIVKNEGELLILNNEGKDVTLNFKQGAKEALSIAKLVEARVAILKDGSPSCGSNLIYDGKFNGNKIKGEGITAKLFRENGIKVYSENDLDKIDLESI